MEQNELKDEYEFVINGAVVPSGTVIRQQIPLQGMMLAEYSGSSPATYPLFAWTTVLACNDPREVSIRKPPPRSFVTARTGVWVCRLTRPVLRVEAKRCITNLYGQIVAAV